MGRKIKYFGRKEEDAIVRYKYEEDIEKKNRIYEDDLHDVFYRLVEAILNRYKLYDFSKLSTQNMIDDCVSYTVSKIDRFDEKIRKCTFCKTRLYDKICPTCKNKTKNIKAYSFFGTVAKRYYISERKKGQVTHPTIDPHDNDSEEYSELNTCIMIDTEENDEIHQFFKFIINYLKQNEFEICEGDMDRKKMFEAILIMMKDTTSIPFFNKKSVYHIVKELTGITQQPKITEFFKALIRVYKKGKLKYYV